MKLKLLIIIQLVVTLVVPIPTFAATQTITHTIKQPFGGSQSPDDARIAGIAKAKREALEQAGTYIESSTIVKDSQVDSDEILALTAGVTKAEVIKQKNYIDGDAFGIEITVKVEFDTTVLEKSLERLLKDRNHLKDLKTALEREKKLLARIAELEKQNSTMGKTTQQTETLKKDFQITSSWLAAVDWFSKAVDLWDGEKLSNPEMAIEYLTEAIRLDPDFALAYSLRGVAYADIKEYERAIADHDQAIRLDPNDASAYHNRGGTYLVKRQYDLAISDFDQAIRFNPNAAKAYLLRGVAFFGLKQFDRAIEDLTQAIRLDPKIKIANYFRGRANAILAQYDLAISDYDQAIRLDPNNASAYYNRGLTYGELGQYDRAISDFDQAIRLKPNNAKAYHNRGVTYGELKQFDRAIEDLTQAIRLDPNDASAYHNRGRSYLKSNKSRNGCADLEKACTLGDCEAYEEVQRVKLCDKTE